MTRIVAHVPNLAVARGGEAWWVCHISHLNLVFEVDSVESPATYTFTLDDGEDIELIDPLEVETHTDYDTDDIGIGGALVASLITRERRELRIVWHEQPGPHWFPMSRSWRERWGGFSPNRAILPPRTPRLRLLPRMDEESLTAAGFQPLGYIDQVESVRIHEDDRAFDTPLVARQQREISFNVQISPEEMDAARRFNREEIARIYGIPANLIAPVEEVIRRGDLEHTSFDFNAEASTFTVNEIRAMEGLPALPGADPFITPHRSPDILPESQVIDEIDRLVNDQIRPGPRDDYNADRYDKCRQCHHDWHGLECGLDICDCINTDWLEGK